MLRLLFGVIHACFGPHMSRSPLHRGADFKGGRGLSGVTGDEEQGDSGQQLWQALARHLLPVRLGRVWRRMASRKWPASQNDCQ